MPELNLTAPINQLGYGIASLNILLELTRRKIDVALWPMGVSEAPPSTHDIISKALRRADSFNLHATSFRIAHPWDFAHQAGKGHRAGLTFFETNVLSPAEKHHLGSLDTLFVSSTWAGEVCKKNGLFNTAYAPLGVDRGIFHPGVKPVTWQGLEPGTTVFLNVGKWEYRKGHDVLPYAFREAFGEKEKVLLVMACSNPFLPPERQQEWVTLYKETLGSQVLILEERLATQNMLAELMAAADCGVFPSRSEGWNLELLEMMSMGKAVITTFYSAHTEYCTEENACLIDISQTEKAYDGLFFRDENTLSQWAALDEPAIGQLVSHLREVHRLKQSVDLSLNQAGIETAERYSWANTVSEILSYLPLECP